MKQEDWEGFWQAQRQESEIQFKMLSLGVQAYKAAKIMVCIWKWQTSPFLPLCLHLPLCLWEVVISLSDWQTSKQGRTSSGLAATVQIYLLVWTAFTFLFCLLKWWFAQKIYFYNVPLIPNVVDKPRRVTSLTFASLIWRWSCEANVVNK